MESVLIGPFAQVLTLRDLPFGGALTDDQLEIIKDGAVWVENGYVKEVGEYDKLYAKVDHSQVKLQKLDGKQVCLPSFVDCHTHILYGGIRANDFAMRNAGSTYLDIAAAGGGIWNTVQHTRALSEAEMIDVILERSTVLLQQGITTIEVKSGYGLSIEDELRSLRAINKAKEYCKADLITTCLAAHMLPKDYAGTAEQYLNDISSLLFPILKQEKLTHRIDAFIEKSAFSADQIQSYFQHAKSLGFDITVHADQFTCSGSKVAVDFGAISADHLEASTEKEIDALAKSDTVAVALPAASMGLGCQFAPVRRLLDAGAAVAIATDWNPGSAPMGQLMTSASVLATFEKLSNAEVLSAITFRAAKALNLMDRGRLQEGFRADFCVYNTDNYQNITYCQGRLQPQSVWRMGVEIFPQLTT